MPELPDVDVYVECLERRVIGARLDRIRLASPSLLRSYDPPLREAEGRTVADVHRLGKRIVFELAASAGLDPDLFLVVHLMIAGRFRWRARGVALTRKIGLAAFDFSSGTLLLTEASTRKRASLHLVRGAAALAEHDPGGLEVLGSDLASFRTALLSENHTLKRTLTDPRLLAGIGNAYSDEILHAARLSPTRLTKHLAEDEIARLHVAAIDTLGAWRDRLRAEVGGGFPEKVTAFREGMAAHGRYGKPCPICDSKIQRIVYAENECNYCATCQTGGKLLADRSLSRLMKDDWPRTLEEMEERRTGK